MGINISTIFLIIFVGIFSFGVYRQRQCKEFLKKFDAEAEESFKALASKMTSDVFIKKNIRKISVSENVIEELPNVFVSIGIIATFLGLGVAIQGASELLQTDKLELSKLTAVLGVIAFKFQTSVWGICFSIIFRNTIVERYFEFQHQLVDELTDRLYMLERENARTLIERQNELLVVQHKAILAANAAQNQALIERLIAFETSVHADNQIANEYLHNFIENFQDFIEIAQDFGKHELAFSKSVEAFTQRVKLFQEEFATLVHTELADIKTVNEELGRIHAEHIQKIHDEHTSNIFYVTQELDKLHKKFYLETGRFAEESRKMLDELLTKTINSVHDEYIRAVYDIYTTINEIRSTLTMIQENITKTNQEFIAEQKQYVSTWQVATNKVSATMDAFSVSAVKEAERLDTVHKTLESIANKMQSDYANNLNAMTMRLTDWQKDFSTIFKSFMSEQKSANVNYLAEMSTQSQSIADSVKSLQKNISNSSLTNQIAIENLRGDLIAVKNALEDLTVTLNAEGTELKKLVEYKPVSLPKFMPMVSPAKSEKSTGFIDRSKQDKEINRRDINETK